MAGIFGIVSRLALTIEVHHRNQPNKSKLVLNSGLNQLCISNKTKHFSYEGGCDVCGHHTCIEGFKRRACLGYR